MIFDLDGTLLDTLQDLAGAANRVCAARGWPQHPLSAYRRFVGNGIPKLVERFSPPQHRDPAALAATRTAFSQEYAAHMREKTAPYPGISRLLDRLRAVGVRTAVFSNKDDAFTRQIVAEFFGPDAFAAVRGAVPDVPVKPDPQGVLALLNGLRADPQTTLFVGDSDVDVLTAHNAGLLCCGVLWGFRGRAELTAAGADFLAADTDALFHIILQTEDHHETL